MKSLKELLQRKKRQTAQDSGLIKRPEFITFAEQYARSSSSWGTERSHPQSEWTFTGLGTNYFWQKTLTVNFKKEDGSWRSIPFSEDEVVADFNKSLGVE